jgi:hypothetical protein
MAGDSTARGVVLTGELLSYEEESGEIEGRPWVNYVAKLLMPGDFIERVKYRKQAEGDEALSGAQRGDTVSLRVIPQGAWDEQTGRRSKVTWRGVTAGA